MVLRLLYRDGLMLVIDKPAGLAVHRGPNGGESLEDHFDALRFGLPRAPALAHRLDRDTSGCLVLGRHRKALAKLGRLFKKGRSSARPIGPWSKGMLRTWGSGRRRTSARPARRNARLVDEARSARPAGGDEVEGVGHSSLTSPWRGEVDLPKAGRVGVSDPRASPHPDGFAVDPPPPGEGVKLSWLALEPLTGRTHQLRVHCAEMGRPILGDAIYAPRAAAGPRSICTPAKSSYRSTRTARPSRCRRRCRRRCAPCLRSVGGSEGRRNSRQPSFRVPNKAREPEPIATEK